MVEMITGIARGVVRFYAWTVGGGIVLLSLVMLWQGAADLVREWASPKAQRGRSSGSDDITRQDASATGRPLTAPDHGDQPSMPTRTDSLTLRHVAGMSR